MINIQISVLIWTILSFCILAFVLNKFLFKPLLKIMDDRKAKIDNYQHDKAEQIEQAQIKRAQIEEERVRAQKEAVAAGNEMLEREKEKTDEMINKARDEYGLLLEQERSKVKKETDEMENNLEKEVEDLARQFAETLLS